MSIFDNLGDQAKDVAGDHEEKLGEGVERAGDFADERTEGRYSEQVDKGQDTASDFFDRFGDDEEEDERR